MSESKNDFGLVASQQTHASGSDRAAADAGSSLSSVGTKRPIHAISGPDIWTEEFWTIVFERLSTDMRKDPVITNAIHPFLTMMDDQTHQAHSDHIETPTESSFKNLEEKHAFVLHLRRTIWRHEENGHITYAQERKMYEIFEYEERVPSVGTKRPIDDIFGPKIWTDAFWTNVFARLSNDMKRESFITKAIHPFLDMMRNQIHQAHSHHMTTPTESSFINFQEKHAFVLSVKDSIFRHEAARHITREQELEMYEILKYDFDDEP